MGNYDVISRLMADRPRDTASGVSSSPERDAGIGRERASGIHGRSAEEEDALHSVDLLGLIRRDTGEQGSERGERIDFKGKCPICGSHDCLRYYPATNTYTCFDDENPGPRGGTFIDYMKVTRGMTTREAFDELRSQTGMEARPARPATQRNHAQEAEARNGRPWPAVTHCLLDEAPPRAPVLIDGVLRKGHKLLVVGPSKAGKTFLMLELAVAVATGGEWMGKACERGRVLFINPELDTASGEKRLLKVCQALDVSLAEVKASVDFLHLRGFSATASELVSHLLDDVPDHYELIILDSLYKVFEGDENSADDVKKFFNSIDRLITGKGCAVAMIHHHAKGNRSGYTALDRGSGSGVFGRDPEAIIDLSELVAPNIEDVPGFTVWKVSDSGNREFKSLEPFHLIFEYPLHRVDVEGVTSDWKLPNAQRDGGKATAEVNKAKREVRRLTCEGALLAELHVRDDDSSGIPASEAANICASVLGESITAKTVRMYVEDSDRLEVVKKTKQRWSVVPSRPRRTVEQQLETDV